jgi:hypothetical protein
MKSRSILIIGTFSILTFLGLVITNTKSITEKNLSYLRESEKEDGRGFSGAAEYSRMIKADPATGVINPEYVRAAYMQLNNMSKYRTGLLTWNFKGPDNVGGRTRTLIVDNQNPQILYAGGVSGGIFKSTNGGEVWNSIGYTPELGGLIISCGAQTTNGDLYFGTGEQNFTRASNGDLTSGVMGGGIYKSTDRGVTWTRLASTTGTRWENIQGIAASPSDPAKVYAATQSGLYETSDGGQTWTTYPGSLGQRYIDVRVSPNGKTIFAATYTTAGCKVYRSIDRSNLAQVGSTTISSSTVRVVIAIAPSNANYVYVSAASRGSGISWGQNALEGIYQSSDNGDTWKLVVSGGTEAEPFGSSGLWQGDYDHCIAVDPYNPMKFYMGGVDFYIFNDPFWYKGASTQEYYDPATKLITNPYYIHADKHAIVFDTVSKPYKMYVVTDGGVVISKDAQYQKYPTYKTININYTTSQFYACAASKYGDITGGAQDNGTFRIETNSISGRNATEILGGDGFYTEISRYDPNVCFSEAQNGSLNRSKDGGKNQQSLKTGKIKSITTFPFNTPMRIWEDMVHQTFIDSTLPPPYTFDSLLEISKFFYADQYKLWINLDAHDFAKDADQWYGIPMPSLPNPLCMEYTKDGNTVFVGGQHWSGTGYLYRISGLKNAVFTYNANSDFDYAAAGITVELIQSWASRSVTGIGISPGNDSNVVVTLGNYVGTQPHIFITKNALVSDFVNNGTFSSIQGNLPYMPAYDAAIHSLGNSTDTIIVTTEMGVFSSTNGGATWSEANDGMQRVPTYMIRQVHAEPWHDGFFYYIATHGRGIFSGTIGTNLNNSVNTKYIQPEMSVYPNPAVNSTNVVFNLTKTSNISIQVFDLNGRILQTYNFKQAKEGTNTYQINTSTFKSGTYLIRSVVEGKAVISKLIISK